MKESEVYLEVEYQNRVIPVTKRVRRVQDLLRHLNLNPEEVLVFRNEEVLTEDEPLRQGDRIFILEVISRG